MSKTPILALPLAAAVLIASHALTVGAQGSSVTQGSAVTAGTRAEPADAGARVLPLVRPSSFAGYRAFSDQEVKDWRESNDNVGRIGGWRVYAKESAPPKPVENAPAAPADGNRSGPGIPPAPSGLHQRH